MKYELTITAEIEVDDYVEAVTIAASVAGAVKASDQRVTVTSVTNKVKHQYGGQTILHQGPNVMTWNPNESI